MKKSHLMSVIALMCFMLTAASSEASDKKAPDLQVSVFTVENDFEAVDFTSVDFIAPAIFVLDDVKAEKPAVVATKLSVSPIEVVLPANKAPPKYLYRCSL